MQFPEALTLSITVAAINISNSLPDEDVELLAAIFLQLGDTLTTITTARQREVSAAKSESGA